MVIGGIQLPNSCIRILGVLRSYTDGLSQQQIISETGLSERAVKYAVKRLVNVRAVHEFLISGDLRRKTYTMRVIDYDTCK